jgi:CRP-like cAMP-binding protein
MGELFPSFFLRGEKNCPIVFTATSCVCAIFKRIYGSFLDKECLMLSIHHELHHPFHSNFFYNLNKEILKEVQKNEHARCYKKKQVLYYEGNPVVGIYYIKSGKAKVYKTGPEGRQYTLRLAKEGDVLALESSLKSAAYFL